MNSKVAVSENDDVEKIVNFFNFCIASCVLTRKYRALIAMYARSVEKYAARSFAIHARNFSRQNTMGIGHNSRIKSRLFCT